MEGERTKSGSQNCLKKLVLLNFPLSNNTYTLHSSHFWMFINAPANHFLFATTKINSNTTFFINSQNTHKKTNSLSLKTFSSSFHTFQYKKKKKKTLFEKQNKSWRNTQHNIYVFLSLYTLKHRIKCKKNHFFFTLSWPSSSMCCYCSYLQVHWLVTVKLLYHMIIKLSPLMDKEEYFFLGLFITLEVLLRYFHQMCFWVVFILCFYQMGCFKFQPLWKKDVFLFVCFVWITEFKVVFVVVLDVARSYPEG